MKTPIPLSFGTGTSAPADKIAIAVVAPWKDGSGVAATNVQDALNEVVTDLGAPAGASRIGFAPTPGIAGPSVQAAIAQVDGTLTSMQAQIDQAETDIDQAEAALVNTQTAVTEVTAAVAALVEPWQTVVLDSAGYTGTVQFRKDIWGRIMFRGSLNQNDESAQVFTLPVGYRPSATIRLPVPYTNAFASSFIEFNVNQDGTVNSNSSGQGKTLHFNTVSFCLDN